MFEFPRQRKSLAIYVLLIHAALVFHHSFLSSVIAQTLPDQSDAGSLSRQHALTAIKAAAWIPSDMETFVYTRAASQESSYFEQRMLNFNTSFLSLILTDRSAAEAIRKRVLFSLGSARNFKPIAGIPGGSQFEGLAIIGFSQDLQAEILKLLEKDTAEKLSFSHVPASKLKIEAFGSHFTYVAFPEVNLALIANSETLLKEALQRRQQQAAHQQAEPITWLHKVDSSLIAKRVLQLGEGDQSDVIVQVKFDPQMNAPVFECSGEQQVIRHWRNRVNSCFRSAKLPELEAKNHSLGFELSLDVPDQASEQIYPQRANDVLMLTITSLGYLIAP